LEVVSSSSVLEYVIANRKATVFYVPSYYVSEPLLLHRGQNPLRPRSRIGVLALDLGKQSSDRARSQFPRHRWAILTSLLWGLYDSWSRREVVSVLPLFRRRSYLPSCLGVWCSACLVEWLAGARTAYNGANGVRIVLES
jgi:hypothetical protein